MNVCEGCGKEIREEPLCFRCDCGISFAVTVLFRVGAVALCRPEIGLAAEEAPPVSQPFEGRLVA